MNKKRYILIFGELLFLSVSSFFYIKDYLTSTLSEILRKEGYKSIFDSENINFEIWKKHYLNLKDALNSENIVVSNELSEKEGAFLFKDWCGKSLKSKDHNLLDKLKKYCTITIEMQALKSKELDLIDNLKVNKRKRELWNVIFEKNKEEIMNFRAFSKYVSETEKRKVQKLKSWCRNKAKELYIPKNYVISKYFETWCVTEKR